MPNTFAPSKKLAKQLSRQLRPCATWARLRDEVDLATDGELDATQLDLLTDWVQEEFMNRSMRLRRILADALNGPAVAP